MDFNVKDGNKKLLSSALERAREIFGALDQDGDGDITIRSILVHREDEPRRSRLVVKSTPWRDAVLLSTSQTSPRR